MIKMTTTNLAARLLLALSVGLTVHAARGEPASAKKGAAGEGKGAGNALRESGVSWCYNWHPQSQTAMPAGVEFVPMIWGKRDIPAIGQMKGKVLLGFNEPEREKQSNMTVEEALEVWPKLEATKMRLGSPAPAGGGARPGGWLDRFMAGVREKEYRVDFICLHWYGQNHDAEAATADLQKYLNSVYELYHKPIWLTEFALGNNNGSPATVEEQQLFMAKALPMLESLPFLERYSWFVFGERTHNPKHPEIPSTLGLISNGALSPLGMTYANTRGR